MAAVGAKRTSLVRCSITFEQRTSAAGAKWTLIIGQSAKSRVWHDEWQEFWPEASGLSGHSSTTRSCASYESASAAECLSEEGSDRLAEYCAGSSPLCQARESRELNRSSVGIDKEEWRGTRRGQGTDRDELCGRAGSRVLSIGDCASDVWEIATTATTASPMAPRDASKRVTGPVFETCAFPVHAHQQRGSSTHVERT
jgi:hypothetical protein